MALPNHTISITLAPKHWVNIRAALLSVCNDLAAVNSPREKDYHLTYTLIKSVLEDY